MKFSRQRTGALEPFNGLPIFTPHAAFADAEHLYGGPD
jgi:hypothetical protein